MGSIEFEVHHIEGLPDVLRGLGVREVVVVRSRWGVRQKAFKAAYERLPYVERLRWTDSIRLIVYENGAKVMCRHTTETAPTIIKMRKRACGAVSDKLVEDDGTASTPIEADGASCHPGPKVVIDKFYWEKRDMFAGMGAASLGPLNGWTELHTAKWPVVATTIATDCSVGRRNTELDACVLRGPSSTGLGVVRAPSGSAAVGYHMPTPDSSGSQRVPNATTPFSPLRRNALQPSATLPLFTRSMHSTIFNTCGFTDGTGGMVECFKCGQLVGGPWPNSLCHHSTTFSARTQSPNQPFPMMTTSPVNNDTPATEVSGSPPATCPDTPMGANQPLSVDGNAGAGAAQPGFTFGSKNTTTTSAAIAGLHFTKTTNAAVRDRSSAQQQALEAAWDQQRMTAVGRAVNPATRDPTKTFKQQVRDDHASAEPAPPPPPATEPAALAPSTPARGSRLTRSTTANSLDSEMGDTEVGLAHESPAKKGKRRAASPRPPPTPALLEVARTLQLTLFSGDKEPGPAGLQRAHTNIAVLGDHVVNLRNELAAVSSSHGNDTSRLSIDISRACAAHDEQAAIIVTLDSRIGELDVAIRRVADDISDMRNLDGFDHTIDGAPHDLLAVSHHVVLAREEARVETGELRSMLAQVTNTAKSTQVEVTAVREQLDIVTTAAQEAFVKVEGSHGLVQARTEHLEHSIAQAEGRLSDTEARVSILEGTHGKGVEDRVKMLEAGRDRAEKRITDLDRRNIELEKTLLQVRATIARLDSDAAGAALANRAPLPNTMAPPRAVVFGASPPPDQPRALASASPPGMAGIKRTAPPTLDPSPKRILLEDDWPRAFHHNHQIVSLSPIGPGGAEANANTPQSLLRLYVKWVLSSAGYHLPDFFAKYHDNGQSLLVGFRSPKEASMFVNMWTTNNTGPLQDVKAMVADVRSNTVAHGRRGEGVGKGPGPVASSSRVTVEQAREAELAALRPRQQGFQ